MTAAKKGVNLPNRASQVVMMGQMQNMFDFPPAPKLTVLGTLDPARATEEERFGQEIFFGKGRCAVCHPAPFYLDDKMHDLRVERFYTPRTIKWPVDSCRGADQDLHPARHQGFPAVPA